MAQYNEFTRVAAYPRVSTDEQKRRGLSIDAQKAALQSWADSQGLHIVDFYNDAGNSARKKYNKRPELVRLLSDVEAGKIDLIIFTKLDRWFRNIGEYYKVQEILESHGVNWKAIHDDYDTSTSSGRLKINIMLSVAQDEADRDSERIKAVFEAKRANGEAVTGSVPTGYLMQNKKIVKDPHWEAALNVFFSSYLEMKSVSAARHETLLQTGVTVSYQLSCLLLKKTAYYGFFSGVDGVCPPYITKDQYGLIQTLRKRTERKTAEDRIYLFSGIIFCAECGHRFRGLISRYYGAGYTREYFAYNCPGRYNLSVCGNRSNLRETEVERYLLEHVENKMMALSADAKASQRGRGPSPDILRGKIKRKLDRLKELYVNDLIDLESYRSDYDALNLQLSEIPSSPPEPDLQRLQSVFSGNWREKYESLSRPNKRTFWRNTISRIEIHQNRSISFDLLK